MINERRQPIWSDRLTKPIAARIPRRLRPSALLAIKAVHTAAFALIAGCIVAVHVGRDRAGDRGTGRSSRRASRSPRSSSTRATTRSARSRPSRRSSEPRAARSPTCTCRDRSAAGSRCSVARRSSSGSRSTSSAGGTVDAPDRDQAGTTTTSHVACLATCEDTLPRTSRRRFVRGRDPSTIVSACSARDASRIVSAGSPSQIRKVACTPDVRAPRGRSPGRPTPGGRAPGRPGAGGRPAGAGCGARPRSGRSGRPFLEGEPDRLARRAVRGARLIDGQQDPSCPRGFAAASIVTGSRNGAAGPWANRPVAVGPTGPADRGRPQALCYREFG